MMLTSVSVRLLSVKLKVRYISSVYAVGSVHICIRISNTSNRRTCCFGGQRTHAASCFKGQRCNYPVIFQLFLLMPFAILR